MLQRKLSISEGTSDSKADSKMPAHLYVISGPSGVGKTTIINRLIKEMHHLEKIISYTTRPMRPGEMQDETYHYISRVEFEAKKARNEFLEVMEYSGHYYGFGLSKVTILERLKAGTDLIVDMDYSQIADLKQKIPACASFFIAPPSMDALKARLTKRGETPEFIAKRMSYAKDMIDHSDLCDKVVTNADEKLDETVQSIKNVIQDNRSKDKKEELVVNKQPPLMIGVVGVSGSGKTTIATSVVNKLREEKQDVAYLRADHYYKDFKHLTPEEFKRHNFDIPASLDMEGLYNDLKQLAAGKSIKRRKYEYATCPGEDTSEIVLPARIIIIEGMFLLTDERIRKLFSEMLLVDTSLDLANSRRFQRDIEKLGNCEKSLCYYESQIRPAAFSNVLNNKQYVTHTLHNNTLSEQAESVKNAVTIVRNKTQSTVTQSAMLKTALSYSPLLFGLGVFACKMIWGSDKSVAASPSLNSCSM